MAEVDAEVLISLVHARPVLWDKTLEIHKDRNATRNAWREVCLKLKPDFDMIEHDERNAFGKEVIRRWTNLRDSFAKSKKKIKDNRGGSKTKRVKTYIFSDQMQFLNKLYVPRITMDCLQPENDAGVENRLEADKEPQASVEDWEDASSSHEHNSNSKRVPQARSRKYRKPEEMELKILKALEAEKPCPKISFLHSLMPHLDKYDEKNFLQFQMGVLKVIENINNRKEVIRPTTSHCFSPVISHQQLATHSSQSHGLSNQPSSIFPLKLQISDQLSSVPSQLPIPSQPSLYVSHQSVIAPLHQVPTPSHEPSHNNETNASEQSLFQQTRQCTSPESDLKYSPAASVESLSADNIDFGTGN